MFKLTLVVACLIPLALANGYGHEEAYGHGGGGHGYDKSYEPHYPPQPYKFGYDVKDGYGGNLNQKEEGDSYGNKKGSYGYTDAYGIYRHVEYIADKNGFRATVKTNEPGTANENPADVYMHSNAAPSHYEGSKYDGGHKYEGHKYEGHKYEAPYKAASHSAPAYSQPKPLYSSVPKMIAPVYSAPKAIYKSPVYSSPHKSYNTPMRIHAVPVYGDEYY